MKESFCEDVLDKLEQGITVIICDGSYRPLLKTGSAAFTIFNDFREFLRFSPVLYPVYCKKLHFTDYELDSFSCELLSVMLSISSFKPDQKLAVYTDCMTIIESLSSYSQHRKTKFKNSLHQLLFDKLTALISYRNVTFSYVKGHSNNLYQGLVNKVAYKCCERSKKVGFYKYINSVFTPILNK